MDFLHALKYLVFSSYAKCTPHSVLLMLFFLLEATFAKLYEQTLLFGSLRCNKHTYCKAANLISFVLIVNKYSSFIKMFDNFSVPFYSS